MLTSMTISSMVSSHRLLTSMTICPTISPFVIEGSPLTSYTNIPLWWCFPLMKFSSYEVSFLWSFSPPLTSMEKGFSSCSKALYVTDQNLNLGNSSYNHVFPAIIEWLPVSICCLTASDYSPPLFLKRYLFLTRFLPLLIY